MDSPQHPDHDLLIRLDENVKELIRRFEAFTTTQTDHETRLRSLEQWKWRMVGMAAGAGAIGSFLINWLKSKPV